MSLVSTFFSFVPFVFLKHVGGTYSLGLAGRSMVFVGPLSSSITVAPFDVRLEPERRGFAESKLQRRMNNSYLEFLFGMIHS